MSKMDVGQLINAAAALRVAVQTEQVKAIAAKTATAEAYKAREELEAAQAHYDKAVAGLVS